MRILFSPIGNTDPYPNMGKSTKEGSLLHICRFYQPDKIYLFMSKEMYEYHIHDNRYIRALEAMYEYLGKAFTKDNYEIICKEDLEDVHIFDSFYREFDKILKQIHKDYPEAEILLNISSGTPAMKNALFYLSEVSEIKLTPIQVSSPNRSGNFGTREYDVDFVIDMLNDENSHPETIVNRTNVAARQNLNYELQKNILKSLIRTYNYSAAMEVAKNLEDTMPESAFHLISAAYNRFLLKSLQMKEEIKSAGIEFYRYRGEYENLVEYINYLKCLVAREQYLEFTRGITPAVEILFTEAIYKKTGHKISKYTNDKQNKWAEGKLRSDDFGREVIEIFEKAYNSSNIFGFVKTDQLQRIIESHSMFHDEALSKKAKEIRSIEEDVRNKAAHTIVAIDNKYLKSVVKKTAEEILDMLIDFALTLNLGIVMASFNSYDEMNKVIIQTIEELKKAGE